MKKYKLNRKRSYYGTDLIKFGSLSIMILSAYFTINAFSPMISLNDKVSAQSIDIGNVYTESNKNRIIIPSLNLEVDYYPGDQRVLNKGAWHRFPDRGNPRDGGNFILAAHRFKMDWTPWHTNRSSPFYNLHKLNSGDRVFINFEDNLYEYEISKIYEVAPNATQIEERTTEDKLTLYTCTFGGAGEGRLVVEALPTSSKKTLKNKL